MDEDFVWTDLSVISHHTLTDFVRFPDIFQLLGPFLDFPLVTYIYSPCTSIHTLVFYKEEHTRCSVNINDTYPPHIDEIVITSPNSKILIQTGIYTKPHIITFNVDNINRRDLWRYFSTSVEFDRVLEVPADILSSIRIQMKDGRIVNIRAECV